MTGWWKVVPPALLGLITPCLAQPVLPPRLAPGAGAGPVQPPNFQVFLQQDDPGIQKWIEEAAGAEARARAFLAAGDSAKAQKEFGHAVSVLQDKVLAKATVPEHRNIVVFRHADFGAMYAPAVRAVREIIAGFPIEGREYYRSRYEDEAAALWKKALAGGRAADMLAVGELYGNTAPGVRALETSADLLMDRGDFSGAADLYRRLLSSPPELPLDRTAVRVKLAVCAAGAGRPEPAAAALAAGWADPIRSTALAARLAAWSTSGGSPAAAWLLAAGPLVEPANSGLVTLRGRPVPAAQVLLDSLSTAVRRREQRRSTDTPWTSLGHTATHDRAGEPLVGAMRPVARSDTKLPTEPIVVEGGRSFSPRGAAAGHAAINPYHAAFHGTTILVQTQTELLFIDMLNGKLAGNRSLDTAPPPEQNAGWNSTGTRLTGNDRFVCVLGDRAFVKTGRPPKVNAMARFQGGPAMTPNTVELKAVDLTTTELIPWRPAGRTPDDAEFLKNGYFLTAPVAGPGGRLYCGFINKRNENHLICLEAESGLLLWKTLIATGETFLGGNWSSAQVEGTMPAVDGDAVYYCTNMGAAAAVNAADGRVKWVSVYERSRSTGAGNPNYTYPWRNCPPIVRDGWAYLAPLDDADLIAVECATGRAMRISVRTDTPRYLAGAALTRDVATGELVPAVFVVGKVVTAVALHSQRRLWEAGFKLITGDRDEEIAGRPALTENQLLLPTRNGVVALDLQKSIDIGDIPDREIYVRQVRKELEVPFALPADRPEGAANLAVRAGRLIMLYEQHAGGSHEGCVYILTSARAALADASRRLAGDPRAFDNRLAEGRAALAAGRWAAASEGLLSAADVLIKSGAVKLVPDVAEKLSEDLTALAEKDAAKALDLLRAARELTDTPAGKARVLYAMSEVFAAAGKDAEALVNLHTLLLTARTSDRWPREGVLVGIGDGVKTDVLELARVRIRDIAAKASREAARHHEDLAAKDLEKAMEGSNPAPFLEIHRRYPGSQAAAKALLMVAKFRETDGLPRTAIDTYATVRRERPGTAFAWEAAARELPLLEQTGRRAQAHQLLSSLLAAPADAKLPDGGTVVAFAKARLAREEYAGLRPLLNPTPLSGIAEQPAWSVALAGARVLSPESGGALPPVAMVGTAEGVQARRLSDGGLAWKADAASANAGNYAEGWIRPRIHSRVYGNRLFVGFPGALAAVDVNSGKLIWGEAEGKPRAAADVVRDAPPAEMTGLRLLRDWGVCAGYDLGADQIVASRVGRLGEDSGEARFVVFGPQSAKVAGVRVRQIADVGRTIGAPVHNGERLAAATRNFAVHVHRMFGPAAGRPEFVISPEGALTGPLLLSSDGRRLIVGVPAGVRAYALPEADGEPISIAWRLDDPDRSYEAVSCRDGRLVLLSSDHRVRVLDDRTGRTLASLAGVRSDAGRLLDCICIPGLPTDLLVFGGSYLKAQADRKAVGYEVVAVEPAAGKVAWRKLLSAPEADVSRGGIWLTPVVAGSRIWLGAVTAPRADAAKAEMNVWAVGVDGGGEPLHRRFPMNPGPGEFRPGRIGDNVFGVVGGMLLIADGTSLAAYPSKK